MSKKYEEMENKELLDLVVEAGLEESARELAKEKGKSPSKLTKEILIETLNSTKSVKGGTKPTPIVPKKEAIEVAKRYAHSKVMVIVTDHDTSVSAENEDEKRTFTFRWGNKLGKQADVIRYDGKPFALRQGAIDAMKHVKLSSNAQAKSTRPKNRWSIVEVASMSEEQLTNLAKKQALKKPLELD